MRLRFDKRETTPVWIRILIPVVCILLSFVICGFVLLALKIDPFKAYGKMLNGAFGSANNLSESILQGLPLMLCGLGVAVSFKMNVNNIGAEGQFVMGAWAATAFACYIDGIPEWAVFPICFVVAFAAGAIWGVIAVIPKALWNVSETIISLMMNYIALLWLDYWCYGSWRDPAAANLPFCKPYPDYARLDTFFGRVNTSLIWAIVAAVLIFLFYKYTSRGYQIRVIGINPKAARYAGLDVNKNIILVMAISGGLAGLAGLSYCAGTTGILKPQVANGAGYTAITIAYLSKFNPFVILLVSFLFGALTQGSFAVQLMNVPVQIVTMMQGLILLCVLGGEIFTRNKLVVRRSKSSKKEVGA